MPAKRGKGVGRAASDEVCSTVDHNGVVTLAQQLKRVVFLTMIALKLRFIMKQQAAPFSVPNVVPNEEAENQVKKASAEGSHTSDG